MVMTIKESIKELCTRKHLAILSSVILILGTLLTIAVGVLKYKGIIHQDVTVPPGIFDLLTSESKRSYLCLLSNGTEIPCTTMATKINENTNIGSLGQSPNPERSLTTSPITSVGTQEDHPKNRAEKEMRPMSPSDLPESDIPPHSQEDSSSHEEEKKKKKRPAKLVIDPSLLQRILTLEEKKQSDGMMRFTYPDPPQLVVRGPTPPPLMARTPERSSPSRAATPAGRPRFKRRLAYEPAQLGQVGGDYDWIPPSEEDYDASGDDDVFFEA
jgi:hypothetical protein